MVETAYDTSGTALSTALSIEILRVNSVDGAFHNMLYSTVVVQCSISLFC